MNPKANKLVYRSPYHFDVWFTNGETKRFNLTPYLTYPVYEKLKEEAYCAKATVRNGIVVWDEKTDMDPDRLYLESELLPVT